jgi:hypothetical protein
MIANRRHPVVLVALLTGMVLTGLAFAQELLPPPTPVEKEDQVELFPPAPCHGDKPLPINLATALRLANAQAWDILIAAQRIEIAAAVLEGARVLWVPDVYGGVDWQHHDGPIQEVPGDIIKTSRSSLYTGLSPQAIFNVSDAIFEPLAQRQEVRARQADLQAATNDTILAVAEAYFNVEEATGDLSAAQDVVRRAKLLVDKIAKLAADGLIGDVEVARARVQLARFEQVARSARERWQVEAAELVRIIRLQPDTLVEPLEPPNLQITLIDPAVCSDNVVEWAITNRPELAARAALVQEAVEHLRQERWRPLLPYLVARGGGTTPPFPLMYGSFGGGLGSTLNNFNSRGDYDLEAIWELRNMGVGNHAIIRQRRAERDEFRMELYRERDLVARQAVQALAQVQSALQRASDAEGELRQGLISYNLNYRGLGEIKRVGGGINILVIRPQEADAALQDLITAYFDYFGTVADYNRAQFRLYWAVGNPGQMLADPNGPNNGCYGQHGCPPPPVPNGCPAPPALPNSSGNGCWGATSNPPAVPVGGAKAEPTPAGGAKAPEPAPAGGAKAPEPAPAGGAKAPEPPPAGGAKAPEPPPAR